MSVEQRDFLDMFFVFHFLVILSAAFSAVAIPPEVGAVTGLGPARDPDDFDYPNKDCIISPIPDREDCPEPEKCHRSGGMCFAPHDRASKRCRQGILDPTRYYGYRVQQWKWATGRFSLAVRGNCSGCHCHARNPPPRRRKNKSDLGAPQTSRRVRSRFRIGSGKAAYKNEQNGYSTEREDEENTLNQPRVAGSSRWGRLRSSDWDTPSAGPSSSSLDEESDHNRAMPPNTQDLAEPEPDSPLLVHNPHYFVSHW
jgi:hypothetical protein